MYVFAWSKIPEIRICSHQHGTSELNVCLDSHRLHQGYYTIQQSDATMTLSFPKILFGQDLWIAHHLRSFLLDVTRSSSTILDNKRHADGLRSGRWILVDFPPMNVWVDSKDSAAPSSVHMVNSSIVFGHWKMAALQQGNCDESWYDHRSDKIDLRGCFVEMSYSVRSFAYMSRLLENKRWVRSEHFPRGYERVCECRSNYTQQNCKLIF